MRHRLQQHNMPVDDWDEDDEARETFNFAPGYNGLVYRANVPDAGARAQVHHADEQHTDQLEAEPDRDAGEDTRDSSNEELHNSSQQGDDGHVKYKLQAMRWGKCSADSIYKAPAHTRRPDSFLDEEKSRLWKHDEDYQLP